jgi:hypothetical protein
VKATQSIATAVPKLAETVELTVSASASTSCSDLSTAMLSDCTVVVVYSTSMDPYQAADPFNSKSHISGNSRFAVLPL